MSNPDSLIASDAKPARHDGWTDERRTVFLEALAQHGVVRSAAAAAGMDASSAYRVRRRAGEEDFARAWDEAINSGFAQLQDIAMERALNGVRVPVFYKGEQVGERVWHDNRLLTFLLSRLQTRRFGPDAAALDRAAEQARANAEAEAELTEMRRELSEVLEGIEREMADCTEWGQSAKLESLEEQIRTRIEEIDEALQVRRAAALAAEFPALQLTAR
jgi:hypothetical protein